MVSIAIIFGIVLSIAHYLSEDFHLHKHKYKVISFGAGIMLAYLILELLPRLYISLTFLNNSLFLFVLVGFSSLHLLEKYIYQHTSRKKRLTKLKEAHSAIFFFYYIIIGIILSDITNKNLIEGTLFFVPLVFHTTLGSLSLNELHHTIKKNLPLKIFLSASPLIGILMATYINIPVPVNHALLGLISGALLFIITREVIPKESKGNPLDFLLGLAVYTIMIVSIWLIA